MDAGATFSCGIASNGSLTCWGPGTAPFYPFDPTKTWRMASSYTRVYAIDTSDAMQASTWDSAAMQASVAGRRWLTVSEGESAICALRCV